MGDFVPKHDIEKLRKHVGRNHAKQHNPNERTRKAVREGIEHGIPVTHIAGFMGISLNTLKRHYRRELREGAFAMMVNVSKTVHEVATDKSDPRALTAAMFLMKTRLGYSEKVKTEVSGPDGGPIEIAAVSKAVLDPRQMSPEAREEFRALIENARSQMIDDEEDGEDLDDDLDEEYPVEDENEG